MKIQSKIILELSGGEAKALRDLLGAQTKNMYKEACINEEGESLLYDMYIEIQNEINNEL